MFLVSALSIYSFRISAAFGAILFLQNLLNLELFFHIIPFAVQKLVYCFLNDFGCLCRCCHYWTVAVDFVASTEYLFYFSFLYSFWLCF